MFKPLGYFGRFLDKSVTVNVRPKILERAAISFITITGILIYLFGVFSILPIVFDGRSPVWVWSWRLLATWILGAFYSNIYLIRKRMSSIRNRMLLQPKVAPMPQPPPKEDASASPSPDLDVQMRKGTTHLIEHSSTPTPQFENTTNWHVCAVCEMFVPPRTWHCYSCRTCILRRDHHCIFTGCCIGEENQSNFLGLLFYMGIGTSLASIFCVIYALYFENITFVWYVFRTFCLLYTLVVDFDIRWILAFLCTFGQSAVWAVFWYYIYAAMKKQTSADAHLKVIRTSPDEKPVSFENMCQFLGPNPLLRIVWPFHPPLKIDYGAPTPNPDFERKYL